jgi:hypothetical protein
MWSIGELDVLCPGRDENPFIPVEENIKNRVVFKVRGSGIKVVFM